VTFKRDDTFSFRRSKSGEVSISHLGKPVTKLRAKAAEKFLNRIETSNLDQAQQIMARATGNFKRGNENSGSR